MHCGATADDESAGQLSIRAVETPKHALRSKAGVFFICTKTGRVEGQAHLSMCGFYFPRVFEISDCIFFGPIPVKLSLIAANQSAQMTSEKGP